MNIGKESLDHKKQGIPQGRDRRKLEAMLQRRVRKPSSRSAELRRAEVKRASFPWKSQDEAHLAFGSFR